MKNSTEKKKNPIKSSKIIKNPQKTAQKPSKSLRYTSLPQPPKKSLKTKPRKKDAHLEKLKKKYIKAYKKNNTVEIDGEKDWEKKNKEMANDQFGFDIGDLTSQINENKSQEKDKSVNEYNDMLSEYNIKAVKNNINELEKNFIYRNTITRVKREKNKRERRPSYLENVKEMEKRFIYDKMDFEEGEEEEYYEDINKFLPFEMRRKSALVGLKDENGALSEFGGKFEGVKHLGKGNEDFNEINKMKKSIVAKSEFIEDDSFDDYEEDEKDFKSQQNDDNLNFEDLDTFVQNKENPDLGYDEGQSLSSEKRLEREQAVIKRKIEKEKEAAKQKALLDNQLGLIMGSNEDIDDYVNKRKYDKNKRNSKKNGKKNSDDLNYEGDENFEDDSEEDSDVFLKVDPNEFKNKNPKKKKKGGFNPFYENFLDPLLKPDEDPSKLTYLPQIYVEQKPDDKSKKPENPEKPSSGKSSSKTLKNGKNSPQEIEKEKFSIKKDPKKKSKKAQKSDKKINKNKKKNKVNKKLIKLINKDLNEDSELDNDTIEGSPYSSLLESDSIKVIVDLINNEHDENNDKNGFVNLRGESGKFNFSKKKRKANQRNYVDIHLGHYKQYVK